GAAVRHFFTFVLSVPGHNEQLGQDVRAVVKVTMNIDELADGAANVAQHDLQVKHLNDHEVAYFLNGAKVDEDAFRMLIGQIEASVAHSMPDTRKLRFMYRDIDLEALRLAELH